MPEKDGLNIESILGAWHAWHIYIEMATMLALTPTGHSGSDQYGISTVDGI